MLYHAVKYYLMIKKVCNTYLRVLTSLVRTYRVSSLYGNANTLTEELLSLMVKQNTNILTYVHPDQEYKHEESNAFSRLCRPGVFIMFSFTINNVLSLKYNFTHDFLHSQRCEAITASRPVFKVVVVNLTEFKQKK